MCAVVVRVCFVSVRPGVMMVCMSVIVRMFVHMGMILHTGRGQWHPSGPRQSMR